MNDIDKLKSVFVNDTEIDEETRQENLEMISKWEKGLRASNAFASWQGHPVTVDILMQARKSYTDTVLVLGRDKRLSPDERVSLFAKQDAMLWLISLASKDVKIELAGINAEIQRALAAIK